MKIDKSFLRDLGERSQTTQIMRSVIDLGHSLNLTVVAEGIECDWQARLLQLLNCDVLQGYHFATPMPFDKIAEFRERQPIQPSGEANEAAVALADAAMRKVARRAGAGASSAA
jgi:EAL domain-containing protein (putative c-di-GMP-specific phosphodiesterase class I)